MIEAAAAEVPVDQAVHLALIANELITNAFKHAYPDGSEGTVEVVFQSKAGERRLEVADHGIGISAEAAPAEAVRGIGISLIDALIAQIDGRLNIQPNEPGTRFVISVPA